MAYIVIMRMLYSTIVLLHLSHIAWTFNIQNITKGIVFTNERRGSQFGYSVALHENKDGKWLLVGAPKDSDGQNIIDSPLPQDGAVYACQLVERRGKNVIKKGRCTRLQLKTPSSKQSTLLFNDFEIANLTQSENDDFDWEPHIGPTMSKNTGPAHDHTIQDEHAGRYMLLESSRPRAVGESAMLETKALPQTNAACVRFWYNMNGETMGGLNLYLFTNASGSRMVWSLEGNQGEDWLEGFVTVVSHEPYKIIFEGVVGQGYYSDIGLDDITILDGVCQKDIKPTKQSLGIALSRDSETGRVLACAPTWSYTCKEENHATGLCYLLDEELTPSATQMLSPCRVPSCTEGKMDLVFLIDGSDSVTTTDFKKIRRWLNNVVGALPVGKYLTRVGVAQYSNRPRTEFNLNQYYTLDGMREAIRSIEYMGRTTATGRAITYITEEVFSKERGMRSDAGHVAVVITDGKSQDDVVPPSVAAKSKGITIFAIGVGSADEEELRNISSDPDNQFVYSVRSYDALDGIRRQLQQKLVALESQGSTFSTEQCQAGMAAAFVQERPVIGLPGLQDWSGGFALYPPPGIQTDADNTIRTGFRDLFSSGDKAQREDTEEEGSSPEGSGENSGIMGRRPSQPVAEGGNAASTSVRMSLQISGHVRHANSSFSSSTVRSYRYAPKEVIAQERFRFPRSAGDPDGDPRAASENQFYSQIQGRLSAEGIKPTDQNFQKLLAHSYLGSSVASGKYSDIFAVEIAVGGPRVLSVGSVYIIQLSEHQEGGAPNDPVIMKELSGDQMGSYFGFSVCLTDLNADGLDELLVGAPLWMGKHEDMGQTILYLSNYARDGTMHPRRKVVLSGPSERNARFGYSIAAAGDLNRDGYADVVVGAPSDAEGDGAIYIYNGGKDADQIRIPTQVVRASETKKKLAFFGFSIHGGIDIDSNGYLDIACGAPGDNRAVVLFSRPVIHVKAKISAFPSVLIISNSSCTALGSDDPSTPIICSEVEICFMATGKRIPQIIYLDFELEVDAERAASYPRAYFREFSNPGELRITTGVETCTRKILIFQQPLRDVTTDILIQMKYSLSPSMIQNVYKSPVLNFRDQNPVFTEISFARDCDDKNCSSDLQLSCWVGGLKSYLDSDVIIIESNRIIDVFVNLTNEAGDAYNVELDVVYNRELFFSRLSILQDEKCVTILHDDDEQPGHLKAENPAHLRAEECDERKKRAVDGGEPKMLQLMYKHTIMSKNAKCRMKLQFGLPEQATFHGGNLSISITAHSANTDANSEDNSCNRTIPVYFSGQALVTGHSNEDHVAFGSNGSAEYISTFDDIGPELTHLYFITNTGTASIPSSSLEFRWPAETTSKHDILYLTDIECMPASKCRCEDRDILVNPDHINTTNAMEVQTNRGGQNVCLSRSNSTDGMEDEFVEVTMACHQLGITCESLHCDISEMKASETIKFVLKFRLWEDTYIRANVWKATIPSTARYSTKRSPFIIPDDSHFSDEVTTVAYSLLGRPVKDDVEPEPPKIWIIIVAVVAGVILLALTTFALYKFGFFESKYKQMKDETLEWRSFGQESAPHEDRIQTNADVAPEERPLTLTTFQRRVPAETPLSM